MQQSTDSNAGLSRRSVPQLSRCVLPWGTRHQLPLWPRMESLTIGPLPSTQGAEQRVLRSRCAQNPRASRQSLCRIPYRSHFSRLFHPPDLDFCRPPAAHRDLASALWDTPRDSSEADVILVPGTEGLAHKLQNLPPLSSLRVFIPRVCAERRDGENRLKANLIAENRGHHHLPSEQTALYYFGVCLPSNLKLVQRKQRVLSVSFSLA